MNLNQFFQIFYSEFNQGESMPEYLIKLVRKFIREPATEKERLLDSKDKFNPLTDDKVVKPSTISSWLSKGEKKGRVSRNMGPKIAERIYTLRDPEKFQLHFEKNASIDQCRGVMKQFRNFHFSVDEDDCFCVSAKIFEKIIEFRTHGKSDVKFEDVELESFVQDSDIFFLQEVGSKCPLCHKQLIKKKNGREVPQYRIVSICQNEQERQSFEELLNKKTPADAGEEEPKISLCLNCANSYEKVPDIEQFSKLLAVKKNAMQDFNLDEKLMATTLEHDVIKVVRKIANIDPDSEENVELEMNPVLLNKKMPNAFALQVMVKAYVQYYYNIINREFINLTRESDFDFEDICLEVRIAFKKIKNIKEDKAKQFEAIVSWMQQKLDLDDDLKIACQCVAAFFVQNCEVFDKDETA